MGIAGCNKAAKAEVNKIDCSGYIDGCCLSNEYE